MFNISEVAGAAQTVANKLRATVERDRDRQPQRRRPAGRRPCISVRPREKEATAEAVGKILDAPVEPRIPALNDKGPGVIVPVTG